uniref:Mitochondrial 39S ribosomal protein L55 n=1 Tax=Pseudodiaptomus poplesia TaxID=213370 RepID=A0A0U2KDY0_9MAXI|nr:mitochondrial 39S ribosomal protein L55 [Pseudodiaptomus poplesia]
MLLLTRMVGLCRLPATALQDSVRHLNANRAAITKIKRERFARVYPTTAVLPDGSTISVKYHEPRGVIRFPIVMETATEEQKNRISLLRRPKKKLVVTKDQGNKFDPMKYVKM